MSFDLRQEVPATPVTLEEAAWRAAVSPGFVHPVFQPIVDLRRGVVAGYEMLARFTAPPEAPPDQWFEAAERTGVAEDLEARMIAAGLEARPALPANCFLTINVDPERLGRPRVQEALAAHTRLHGVVIELTEHARTDEERVAALIPELRQRGAMIAIDDVGAGYSGLRRIGMLRPEFVKIDRDLVGGLHRDPARREMVESLGAVANRIDSWVVAEGIECRAELEVLIDVGVPLGQGFGLARPSRAMAAPDAELTGWIAAQSAGQEERGSGGRLWRDAAAISSRAPHVEIRGRLLDDEELMHLPVVDERGRPVGLLSRERYLGGALRPDRALLALVGDDPAGLARRAMARPRPSRFDPLVFCDETGRYVGLIEVERLVEALATQVSSR